MADPVFDIIAAATGASATGSGSTITFLYPTSRSKSAYVGQWPAYLGVRALQGIYTQDTDFSVAYGDTSITVTLGATVPAIAANTPVFLQLPLSDTSGYPVVYGTALPDSLQPVGK